MSRILRIRFASGAIVAGVVAPLLGASVSALNSQATPTTQAPEAVDPSTSTIDVAAMDPSGVLEQLRTGLAGYLAGFPGLEENTSVGECPLDAVEELLTAVASIGPAGISADIQATIHVADVPASDGSSPTAAQVVPIGVVCDTDDADEVRPPGTTGGIYGVSMAVFDYSVAPDIDLSDVAVQFPDTVPPSADTFGFTGYRGCLGGSEAEGTTQCYSWWERGRLIVGRYVTVDRDAVDETLAAVSDVARPVVAAMLDLLAEGPSVADPATATSTVS